MISSPDQNSSRSRLADWIELIALTRGRPAGQADLASLSRLTSDDSRARERTAEGDLLEEEIVESGLEQLIDRVTEEIGSRADALGNDYPFEFKSHPFQVKPKDKGDAASPAHLVYCFSLLMTAALDRVLPSNNQIETKIDRGRRLFHICASVGVAGLINVGHTFWFGFPRPEKTGFSEALRNLCAMLGFARQMNPSPSGLPEKPKDDQVDVVGWRRFGDGRIGTLIIVCQAATGADWDGKSVVNHLEAFCSWFERPPYGRAMACLAIPFPAHHEVTEPDRDDFDTAAHNALLRLNQRHGVLVDRLRITQAVMPLVSDKGADQRVAGLVEIPALQTWVEETVALVS